MAHTELPELSRHEQMPLEDFLAVLKEVIEHKAGIGNNGRALELVIRFNNEIVATPESFFQIKAVYENDNRIGIPQRFLVSD